MFANSQPVIECISVPSIPSFQAVSLQPRVTRSRPQIAAQPQPLPWYERSRSSRIARPDSLRAIEGAFFAALLAGLLLMAGGFAAQILN